VPCCRENRESTSLLVLPGLTWGKTAMCTTKRMRSLHAEPDVVINLVGILNERGFGGPPHPEA